MATETVDVNVAVERIDECSGDLASDLIHLEDAIHAQKANLSGVPEELRKEATELRAQLSCVSLLDRLEGLKDSLASAAVGDGRESEEQCLSGTLNAVDALYAAEKIDVDSDLEDMLSALNVRPSVVNAMHTVHVDLSAFMLGPINILRVPQDAKEFAAKLETDKMRLQKEMLELQLLMHADCGNGSLEKGLLPDSLTSGHDSDRDSPRISASPEDGGKDIEQSS